MQSGLLLATSRNEVVTVVAGASAGLGGLILVFLGVVIAGLSAYGGETARNVLEPLRRAATAILIVFGLSLLSTALAVAWLATDTGPGALYEAALWAFFLTLLGVLGTAIATVRVALS